jgi:MFS family permease
LTIVSLAAGVLLLVAFVLVERRVTEPLLPLHIVVDRARGGAYLAIALSGSGVFAVFLFLTYYMQQNLGYSPITTGLAFLPMSAMIVTTSTVVQTRVLKRTGAKPLVLTGMVLGIAAMIFFTGLVPADNYATHVLPGLLIIGLGMGMIFAPCLSTATLGVKPEQAGIAAATLNTSQQVGGSVGTALLSTIFASATANYISSHARGHGLQDLASVHGYTTAFWWAAGIFTVGLIATLVVLPAGKTVPSAVEEQSHIVPPQKIPPRMATDAFPSAHGCRLHDSDHAPAPGTEAGGDEQRARKARVDMQRSAAPTSTNGSK